VTAAVMGLIKRQPARPVGVARLELVGAIGERASDLVAARALLACDLGVRHRRQHARPAARGSGRSRAGGWTAARESRWTSVSLGGRPPTVLTAVAALAPHQPRQPPGDRQVTHPHKRRSLTRTSLPPQWGHPVARASSSTCSPVRCTSVTTRPSNPTRRVAWSCVRCSSWLRDL
jgi:hypothetical protein